MESVGTLDWYSESENDLALSIETKKYSNGNLVKRCFLSDGRVAICRELTGADCVESDKISQSKQELVYSAMMALSAKIDDKPVVLEDLLQMKAKDFNRIKIMTVTLNF